MVIGIVGMPAAGKSTALEIASSYGDIIIMGDVIREETLAQGLKITSQNLGNTARQIREKEGKGIIAKRCIEKIHDSVSDNIFIDGIRSMDEVIIFRSQFNLKLFAIEAEDVIRHKWILDRKRADDSSSMEKIMARDNREIDFGLKQVIENADYKIQNDSDITTLKQKCKKIIEDLIEN